MSLKKIERPDWLREIVGVFDGNVRVIERANDWFTQNVEPVNRLLEEAEPVYSCNKHTGMACALWGREDREDYHNTHKAYVIAVQPIKHETAEELLREFINKRPDGLVLAAFIERAKKVLERGE